MKGWKLPPNYPAYNIHRATTGCNTHSGVKIKRVRIVTVLFCLYIKLEHLLDIATSTGEWAQLLTQCNMGVSRSMCGRHMYCWVLLGMCVTMCHPERLMPPDKLIGKFIYHFLLLPHYFFVLISLFLVMDVLSFSVCIWMCIRNVTLQNVMTKLPTTSHSFIRLCKYIFKTLKKVSAYDNYSCAFTENILFRSSEVTIWIIK